MTFDHWYQSVCLLLAVRGVFTYTANGKRQILSWEFLKIENEQLKYSSYGWEIARNTNLYVEIINSKPQVKEKLGHVVQIRLWRKRDAFNLSSYRSLWRGDRRERSLRRVLEIFIPRYFK